SARGRVGCRRSGEPREPHWLAARAGATRRTGAAPCGSARARRGLRGKRSGTHLRAGFRRNRSPFGTRVDAAVAGGDDGLSVLLAVRRDRRRCRLVLERIDMTSDAFSEKEGHEVRRIVALLRKMTRSWPIVLIALGVAALAYAGFNYLRHPKYQSETVLLYPQGVTSADPLEQQAQN